MGVLHLLTKECGTCMVFVRDSLTEPTVGMTSAVIFSWMTELEDVVKISPLVDKVVKGE